jgi:peroxiredoxin
VPCREEASTLASVAALYRSSGVAFLGVDVRDTTPSALAFTRSFGITYPSVTDPSSAITLDFTAVVPIAGTPTTLVIDQTGHIAGAVFGSATYPELTAILAKVTGKAADEAVSR